MFIANCKLPTANCKRDIVMNILMRFAVVILGLFIFLPSFASAGSLDAPAAPTDAGSAMFSLEDIFKELGSSTPTVAGSSTSIPAVRRGGATSFVEPAAGPASTGHTLDDVMALVRSRARTEKTGQTATFATGDDGDVEKGITWPNPRFTIDGAGTGTVVDNLTTLIWLKNANCTDELGGVTFTSSKLNWTDSLTWTAALKDGSCGLSDSSATGDWRLPNVKELQSLIDFSKSNPALQTDHPFTSVQLSAYWSSTTHVGNTANAWFVVLGLVNVASVTKTTTFFVWPVRGGQ
ncbi:MAG: Lcl C-terminal domain-containing protein [Candidatus Anammoxibacter sp.]